MPICPGGNLPYIQITSMVLPYIRLPYKRTVVYSYWRSFLTCTSSRRSCWSLILIKRYELMNEVRDRTGGQLFKEAFHIYDSIWLALGRTLTRLPKMPPNSSVTWLMVSFFVECGTSCFSGQMFVRECHAKQGEISFSPNLEPGE